MIPLFVYGSLRPGKQNNHRLAVDAIHKGTFKTRDKYYMIGLKSGAYPYVTDEPLCSELQPIEITGDLYEVTPTVLNWLDLLEANYQRVNVTLDNNQEAQMYMLLEPKIKNEIRKYFDNGWTRRFKGVPSGDWYNA